jgi:hypothetical protein
MPEGNLSFAVLVLSITRVVTGRDLTSLAIWLLRVKRCEPPDVWTDLFNDVTGVNVMPSSSIPVVRLEISAVVGADEVSDKESTLLPNGICSPLGIADTVPIATCDSESLSSQA